MGTAAHVSGAAATAATVVVATGVATGAVASIGCAAASGGAAAGVRGAAAPAAGSVLGAERHGGQNAAIARNLPKLRPEILQLEPLQKVDFTLTMLDQAALPFEFLSCMLGILLHII